MQEGFTVIIADGDFPRNPVPLGYLNTAERIVCCDGGTEALTAAGYTPDAIVGDLDSLSDELRARFFGKIYEDKSQENNDLTKAVEWCHRRGHNDIVILGATGKREDHTLGNISLLAEYIKYMNVIMVTDTGIFRPFQGSFTMETYRGQQISIFSIDSDTGVTSDGLRYQMNNMKLTNWWVATLNEATGDSFSLHFSQGRIIVYLKF